MAKLRGIDPDVWALFIQKRGSKETSVFLKELLDAKPQFIEKVIEKTVKETVAVQDPITNDLKAELELLRKENAKYKKKLKKLIDEE